MLSLTGVASATAHKALSWLHDQGVVGYDAYRNGVGIRIFINIASSSIRVGQKSSEKFLPASPTSKQQHHTSIGETPLKDQIPKREFRDTGINPFAPKNGAPNKNTYSSNSASEGVVAVDNTSREGPFGKASQAQSHLAANPVRRTDSFGKSRARTYV
ncbi:MAG: hypothetical protein WKF84_02005 [Pyrinomonadaceae bacterium]